MDEYLLYYAGYDDLNLNVIMLYNVTEMQDYLFR